MPMDLCLAFQILRESASPGLYKGLLGLRLVPITRGKKGCLPAPLKIVRGFGHGSPL